MITIKMIERRLEDACRGIRASKPNGQRRLGMLFVAPRWKTDLRHDLDRRIDAWISAVRKIDCAAIAWVFPGKTRYSKSDGYFHPGVAVFLKEVKH